MSSRYLNGLILTRHARDTSQGVRLNYWLKTEEGPINVIVENETCVFFVEVQVHLKAEKLLNDQSLTPTKVQALPLKTFNQNSVCGIYFSSLKEFYSARRLLQEHNIKCYEDDFRPEDRFLMERFITSTVLVEAIPINNQHFPQYRVINAKKHDVDVSLSMLSIDLECSMQGRLYSIGAYGKGIEKVFMIGAINTANMPSHTEMVEDEKDLLIKFIEWLNYIDPDVLIGWNVIGFDFSLIQKRCDAHNIEFTIGRNGQSPYWRKNQKSEQVFIDIPGRVVIDGIDMLKNATYNFPSFALDNVANELLGIGKKIDDVENRGQEITEKFHHNKPALAEYNLEDCRLVWLIFEKTQLLDYAKLRGQLTGLELDRIGGSVASFTNLYLPKLHRAGYVAPNMGDGVQSFVSPGGYVMDSIPGLYKHVLVLDFKSLYPSIIRTFKIDPMGMIEGLTAIEKGSTREIEGFDGAYFSRNKHFLPDMIEQLWQERDKAKAEKNSALSQAIKIIMNSFYGILGSTGCRFFDPRLSGSITKRSHELLKVTKTWIEDKYGYKVIYGDTDSIFVHLGDDFVKENCNAEGKKLANYINDKWTEELKNKFELDSQLEIEFETHFSTFLMPTIRGLEIGTKKRYAGIVEKGDAQQLVFKGLESVRTDWTELAKTFQQTLYLKVFNQEPVEQYILDMVEKTRLGKNDHLLIYRKRIRRKLADYIKNVPPHVKAARHADELNESLGKPLRYQSKGWIEYYLTTSGPQTKEHVSAPIDYETYIERQLKAVADGILPFIGTSFEEITDQQLNLF